MIEFNFLHTKIPNAMTARFRSVLDLLDEKLVSVVSTLVTIIAIFLALKTDYPKTIVLAGGGLAFGVFAVTALYSVRVRENNLALQGAMGLIHEINHAYRNGLSNLFASSAVVTDKELIQKEQEVLQMVCDRVSTIFTTLIRRRTTVTVKMITKEGAAWHCNTYVRSEPKSVRDESPLIKFAVNTGENTAFDTALKHAAGGISHFYGGDLRKLKKDKQYRNQRDNFDLFYNSAIVVPIRYLDQELLRNGQAPASDDIGFLCVDTLHRNYLNDRYHVALLAAFADQMYNFISLLRGKYKVPATPVH